MHYINWNLVKTKTSSRVSSKVNIILNILILKFASKFNISELILMSVFHLGYGQVFLNNMIR